MIAKGYDAKFLAEASVDIARALAVEAAKSLAAQIPEPAYPSVAKRTASGDFVPPTPDEGDLGPEDPGADRNLAGTPRRKKGPSHLDVKPAFEHFDTPATMDSGPSKSIKAALVEARFVSEGEQGGIEVYVHRDLQHRVEVNADGSFVARSGWDTRSVAKGTSTEDIEQWLLEEETSK